MPQGVFASLTPEDVPAAVRQRFAKCIATAEHIEDCWIWPMSSASHGYGQIGWGIKGEPRGLVLAHRLSYALFCAPIPEGMTVDHICRNRLCFNPAHLRMLTNAENARDNGMHRRTHCPQGHAYDDANTHVDGRGHRKCRACARARKLVA
jgi:hypothetical protein